MRPKRDPAGANGGVSENTRAAANPYVQSTAPTEVLGADEAHELEVLGELFEAGYRLAVRCTRCGQWLVAPRSVALHVGPVCRSKAGDR